MFEVIFLSVLGLVFLVFASISDIKTTIVPNWLNFSLIIFALGFRFFYSLFVFSGSSLIDFGFFYQGLIGLGIFFVLGNLFYYARVFAGGDAKLMIAMGTILPFKFAFLENILLFSGFILIFFISGAVYGLLWSFYLLLKNPEGFKKKFGMYFNSHKKTFIAFSFFGLISAILGLFYSPLLLFGIFVFVIPYVYFYAKSIEESNMIVKVKPKNLIEGDWVYKKVKVGNKFISAGWEGISNKDINFLIRKNKEVYIRKGIQFVPVFLISFVVFLILFFLKINPIKFF